MLKWISLIAFLAMAVPCIGYALDDSGSSVVDFFAVILCVLTLLLGVVTFLRWRSALKAHPTRMNQLLMLVPVLATAVFLVCFLLTYRKVHKPYLLSAIGGGDHNFEYYFRTDSTLKTVGHYLLNDAQTFQCYRMRGDTILLDTVPPFTGLVSKKYVLHKDTGAVRSPSEKYMMPLNDKGQLVDSVRLYVLEKR